MEGSARPDRKTIERNRRIHMKGLYTSLYHLLPCPAPTITEGDSLPLSDRLDEAVSYIKELQEKVEKMKINKRKLLGDGAGGSGSETRVKLAQIDVHDMQSRGLQVVVTCSPNDRSMFYQVVRVLEEEGAELANANVSVVGCKACIVVRSMIGDSESGFEAGRVVERLKKVVHAFC